MPFLFVVVLLTYFWSLSQLNQDGEGVDGVASRLWTLVSTTSISYAQQAVAALGPLNPVYGPQKLR